VTQRLCSQYNAISYCDMVASVNSVNFSHPRVFNARRLDTIHEYNGQTDTSRQLVPRSHSAARYYI